MESERDLPLSHDGDGGPGRFWRAEGLTKSLRMPHARTPSRVRMRVRDVGKFIAGWDAGRRQLRFYIYAGFRFSTAVRHLG